jgi:hypothetical protein
MNRIRHIRRYAAVLAGLACAWLGLAAAAPAAFANIPIAPRGGPAAPAPEVYTVTHVVVAGGMPGWQIALITVCAALFAAASAVLAYRALATRRQAVTPTA